MNDELVLKILKRTVVFSFFIIGFSLVLFDNPRPVFLGYLFGVIISMLGFKLLHNTINKAITMAPAKASAYSTVHYFIRYFIYFIVLMVAAIADYLYFPATILGLLMVKFVILSSTVIDKKFTK